MTDKAALLLLTILGVMVLAWIFQGVRLYRNCKGDIYSDLYGGFLPYFYRYIVIRDCSESGYLRGKIGVHRIVFSRVGNQEKQQTKFCMIFYNKGVMVLCYDKVTGVFRGKAVGQTWNIIRMDGEGKEHFYRYPNPTFDTKAYLERVVSLFPEVHIEARLAFPDKADLSQLQSDIKAIHFGDIETELRQVQAEFLSDDDVKAMYQKLMQK